MLELDAKTVSELEEQIITDDENEIRAEFGFRKNVEKYPLVYVEQGSDGLVDRIPVVYVGLVMRSDIGNMGSLLVQLSDGRWTRICSAYLKEMQDEVAASAEAASSFDGDGLFG